MTRAGFPHSDTPGSTLGWQLPEAYRSLPRPSSASGAKASTTCSYQLDTHEHTTPLDDTTTARHGRPHHPHDQRHQQKRGAGFFAKTLAHTLNLSNTTHQPRATRPAADQSKTGPQPPTGNPSPGALSEPN